MRKIAVIIFVLVSISANAQIVNKFRDSTWFKSGVRFDSTIYITKGAGNGKVLTSNGSGYATWQTFSSSGVTQGALNDSISAVRSIRKVDSLYKKSTNRDLTYFKINGTEYSVKDSTGGINSLFPNGAEGVTESRDFLDSDKGKILFLFGDSIHLTMPIGQTFTGSAFQTIGLAAIGEGCTFQTDPTYTVRMRSGILADSYQGDVVLCVTGDNPTQSDLGVISSSYVVNGQTSSAYIDSSITQINNYILSLNDSISRLDSSILNAPYIPLTGTVGGIPVTGNIEVIANTKIKAVSAYDNSIMFNEGNIITNVSDGVNTSVFSVQTDKARFVSPLSVITEFTDNGIFTQGGITSVGKITSTDNLSGVIDTFDYPQKIYVDSRLADTASALRALIPNVSSYATITNLKDSTALLRGLIPNVSSYATITNLKDSTSTLRGLITSSIPTFSLSKSTNRDSIVTIYNGTRTAIKDSSIVTPTFSLSKSTNRDSIVTIFNGTRTAIKDSSITTPTLSYGFGNTRDTMVITYNGVRTALRDSSGGGASLSGLTAATATNNIFNTNNKQRWNWNTIGADSAFVLASNSTTAASNLQNVFTVSLSGANATSTQTTRAGIFSNTHTGTSSTNIALQLTASGGSTNTALDVTAGDIQLVSNSWVNFLSNTQRIGSLSGFLQYQAGTSQHIMISTNTSPLCVVASTGGGYFTIAKPTSTTNALIFNGDYTSGNYRGELTYSNVIKTANGVLDICANTGQSGAFASFTPNVVVSVKPTGVLNIKPITATAASAITPAEGDIIMVSSTNGTFATIGLYGYQNGSWQKL